MILDLGIYKIGLKGRSGYIHKSYLHLKFSLNDNTYIITCLYDMFVIDRNVDIYISISVIVQETFLRRNEFNLPDGCRFPEYFTICILLILSNILDISSHIFTESPSLTLFLKTRTSCRSESRPPGSSSTTFRTRRGRSS